MSERLDATEVINSIEWNANEIAPYANRVAEWSSHLTYRMPFETRMEVSLNNAEAALLRALQIIRKTRMSYESKEVA
jgi:hypothetical protein